ncbi:MAG: arginyltransferase [Phycisphaerales bacterium]|nr:arginyltransferase [Phycisphaerales bacterium]
MTDPAKPSRDTLPLSLYLSSPHDCPYLPDRVATDVFSQVHSISAADYELLMNHGFRRSGRLIYRPVCTDCRECVPLRVPTGFFKASKSQRRVVRRNADVTMSIETPRISDEKWSMYADYLRYQHDGKMGEQREDFERFLYDSPTNTIELSFRVGGRLVGVSIVDECPSCWSSVYFYFDPAEARRSLGVYSAICEIEASRSRGLPFWYAGFYIRDCNRMNYKAAYRPFEMLGPDGQWRPGDAASLDD